MVWVCATAASERPEFATYARHGLDFLQRMARPDGAFAWEADRNGLATTDEVHAYGLAFAIYGLAAAARHLGDGASLRAARGAFEYLERVHRDERYGGYFEVSLEGRPKLTGEGGHAIGDDYGQKSQNTHLHLMEAYAELLRAWPSDLVRERLRELVEILAERLFTPEAPGGHLTLFAHPDWTPVSREVSFGHDIEAAHLLLDAADALGYEDEAILARACALADHTLAHGWDPVGGIFYGGVGGTVDDRRKNWWAEAEALLGFATLAARTGAERYWRATAETWAWIRDHQIDRVHGGWCEEADQPEMPKGHPWKAAYHDGRALLFTARLLDSMAEG